MRRAAVKGGVALFALIALAVGSTELGARSGSVGVANYIEGEVFRARSKSQSFNRLRSGSKLYQGDRVKTKDGRFEAKLSDGSLLRLGRNSELALTDVQFAGKKPRRKKKKVRAKLFVGRVWASVTKLFGNDSEFEVETDNAVAGVRGTRFTATRTEDGDTTVRVYSGKVLVSNEPIYKVEGATKETRKEVPGPQEITKDKWTELVAGAMQMVKVASTGEMSPPQSFDLADASADDDWETWNSERDKATKYHEE